MNQMAKQFEATDTVDRDINDFMDEWIRETNRSISIASIYAFNKIMHHKTFVIVVFNCGLINLQAVELKKYTRDPEEQHMDAQDILEEAKKDANFSV